MFFSVNSLVSILLGVTVFLLAPRIADAILSVSPDSGFTARKYRNSLYVWPIRLIAAILISLGIWISTSGPPQRMMKKDESRLLLLEEGQIVEGEVTKSFYQHLAPQGWKVVYKFNVENPATREEKIYWGSAQGPREYYYRLSAGDPVTIIYHPLKPVVNCEIKCFLNYPGFRNTFKAAGKLNLLNKFRNEYEIEDYSFKEWYKLQWEK